jgi:hypothetical protein
MLQLQPVLDPFERLFDPPAAVVQLGKRSGWKGHWIEERCHHHMHPSVRCRHPHQANRGRRGRAFIVPGITGIGRAQDDDLLASTV